jgi:hypothetical protein
MSVICRASRGFRAPIRSENLCFEMSDPTHTLRGRRYSRSEPRRSPEVRDFRGLIFVSGARLDRLHTARRPITLRMQFES